VAKEELESSIYSAKIKELSQLTARDSFIQQHHQTLFVKLEQLASQMLQSNFVAFFFETYFGTVKKSQVNMNFIKIKMQEMRVVFVDYAFTDIVGITPPGTRTG
jgi:hypothetical protein